MAAPSFTNRAEQLDYVFRKFLDFMEALLKKAGVKEWSLDKIRLLPSVALFGKAQEMAVKYGPGLRTHQLGVVYKIVVDHIPEGEDATVIAGEALKVIEILKCPTSNADKFFLYTDIIIALLDLE
jgi:hypothetical protein